MESRKQPNLIGLWSPIMGSGKTTFANYLVEDHRYKRLSFASTLKDMTATFLEGMGLSPQAARGLIQDPELKERPLLAIGGKTPRFLMQTLGTEWGRECIGENIWVDLALARARKELAYQSVVFDDVRFPNEAKAIRAAGGEVFRIIRPDAKASTFATHASEGGLDDFEFDGTVVNNGPIENLRSFAKVLA
jgi:hypothetical protein